MRLGYGLDEVSGFDFRQDKEVILFSEISGPVMGPTESFIQYVRRFMPRG